MKKIIILSSLFFILSFLNSGCTTKNIGGEFAHVVLFWLNNPDSVEDKAAFEESITRFINSSQYVQTMHLGEPAGTPREVVDNSYTYCMIVTFASKEDQDKYQVEDVHKQFVEESKHLWKEVKVFDSMNMW